MEKKSQKSNIFGHVFERGRWEKLRRAPDNVEADGYTHGDSKMGHWSALLNW